MIEINLQILVDLISAFLMLKKLFFKLEKLAR